MVAESFASFRIKVAKLFESKQYSYHLTENLSKLSDDCDISETADYGVTNAR